VTPETLVRAFEEKARARIQVAAEGVERYRVHAPFHFDDGDHLVLVLKRVADRRGLTDEGHTYMRLSYDMDVRDLRKGTRQKVVSDALSMYGVEDRDGELVVVADEASLGDAFFSLVQCILRISDVSLLSRERVRSAFWEDFVAFFQENVPSDRLRLKWHDPERDPEANYVVDMRLNHRPKPLMVFALANDDRTRDATITLHQLEAWQVPHESLGVFEDQEQINRKVLARFTDVSDKQFSSLYGNRDRLKTYLQEVLR
jgi:hypothetical protein